MKTLLSMYSLRLPFYLVYMLQQVEYDPQKFLDWVERAQKKKQTIQSLKVRKSLVPTSKALALIVASYVAAGLFIAGALLLVDSRLPLWFYGLHLLVGLIAAPFIIVLSLSAITLLSSKLIVAPRQQRIIKAAQQKLAAHDATVIAVIGSYGKTTMKELLHTILQESKNVAMTPGNMNTAYSQARFINTLQGDEEVVIIEFGEGAPGDVARMSTIIQPDYAVITGLAPNHLDHYPSLDSVASDLLSVQKHSKATVYASAESELLAKHIGETETFSSKKVLGWTISKPVVSVAQTSFVMKKGKKTLAISCGLLGRHQIAPVALGAALADKLGLSKADIENGCAKIQPFEHRMQPRHIGGAWLIDDTYNGNIEGLVAGLKLLSELDFKRKWYVTPGLVDQGSETENVHTKLGETIAKFPPDIVVLMENSARPIIEKAMKKHGFKGELRVETNPLEFYTSIEHQLAAGDLVLMQNDWTDNYN